MVKMCHNSWRGNRRTSNSSLAMENRPRCNTIVDRDGSSLQMIRPTGSLGDSTQKDFNSELDSTEDVLQCACSSRSARHAMMNDFHIVLWSCLDSEWSCESWYACSVFEKEIQ